ncbi:EAL domain-containing protein [Actinoplanes sp. TBRC 11911]|nr:EAL domain-containing protein [Actinoplanes sp. TBRC 11911]
MLESAIDGAGVSAVYQPIVDLARGVVVGYEALTRFEGYPVSNPELWFGAAGRHGRGADLQATALRKALAERGGLPRNCFLTVNVGPEVLDHPAIRKVWADEGDLRGLVVELTEHFAVDDYTALEPDLNRLRAAGALIAVDDAGSGYAGLTHLLTLRPSMIKLDRALVQDVDQDEAKRALVEMVGTFAGRIDAWLLAEGIERAGELEALAALQVPLAQGYHLSRPAGPWAPITDEAGHLLTMQSVNRDRSGLRPLLERSATVTDVGDAYAAFADPTVDLVVLCDDYQRPIAAIDDRTSPIPLVIPDMKVNVGTRPADAAARAVTRPDWTRPLLCTDDNGRYVGVVRMPRLIQAISSGI